MEPKLQCAKVKFGANKSLFGILLLSVTVSNVSIITLHVSSKSAVPSNTARLASLKSAEGVINFDRIVCYFNIALNSARKMMIRDEHITQLYLMGVLPVIQNSLWKMLNFGTKFKIKTHSNANQLSMQGHLKTLEISRNGAKQLSFYCRMLITTLRPCGQMSHVIWHVRQFWERCTHWAHWSHIMLWGIYSVHYNILISITIKSSCSETVHVILALLFN